MIERLHARLAFDRVRRGWFYTNSTWMLPSIMISQAELLCFMLGTEVATRYAGTAFEGPLTSALTKVSQSLRGPVSVDLKLLTSTALSAPASGADAMETPARL